MTLLVTRNALLLYGRPAMIRAASSSLPPGRLFSSALLAVFRLTSFLFEGVEILLTGARPWLVGSWGAADLGGAAVDFAASAACAPACEATASSAITVAR